MTPASTTRPAPTTVPAVSSSSTSAPSTGDVVGFAVGEVELDGVRRKVAIADTDQLRQRGLMGVSDLGDLDGMLFVFDGTTSVAFTMRDTLIPLDIAFFGEGGEMVGRLEMVPCQAEPCPIYDVGTSFSLALEAPAGGLSGLPDDARILILDPLVPTS